MKSFVVLSTILLSATPTFAWQPPGGPGVPSAGTVTAMIGPPGEFPACEKELIGQFGGLYHYVTQTCPPSSDESNSQSSNNIPCPQCGIQTPGVCGDGTPPPLSRGTAQTLAQAKALVADGLAALESFNTKYSAVPGKRADFIRGLAAYRNQWKAYLDGGGTLAKFNSDYDPSGVILQADKDAKAVWGRHGISGTGSSPWSPVQSDTKAQQNGNDTVTVQNGWQEGSTYYLKTTVGDKTVYFRWLDLTKGDKHSYIAFQVDKLPDGKTAYPAEFAQKNKFTHLLTWQFGTTPLFATSYVDLTP